jgi:hypothetical protein
VRRGEGGNGLISNPPQNVGHLYRRPSATTLILARSWMTWYCRVTSAPSARHASAPRARITLRHYGGTQRCGAGLACGTFKAESSLSGGARLQSRSIFLCSLNWPQRSRLCRKRSIWPFSLPSAASPSQRPALAIGSETSADAAGITDLSAHGLRKAGAIRLAECGAADHEIMSWGGWKTLREVQRYTAAANRKRLALRAADQIKSGTELANLDIQFANKGEN